MRAVLVLLGLGLSMLSIPPLEAMPLRPSQIVGKHKSGITNVQVRRISEVSAVSSIAPRPSTALAGKHRLLVILVETKDAKWPRGFSRSRYQEMIFSKRSLSLREYFRENSYGKFDVTGEVVGPLRVSGSIKDYAFKLGDTNAPVVSLLEKAVRSAGNKIKYADFDHYNLRGVPETDGILDHVMLIYPASSNKAQAFTPIWPHRGTSDVDVGRTRVTGYTIVNHGAPLGVFVHEFAHDLGLPDLYDRDYSSHGAGRWALMGTGSWAKSGNLPSHISAWGKAQLGWLQPTIVSKSQKNIRLPASSEKPVALKLPIGSVDSREYFLIENRRRVGFDRKIPAEGVVIWHIDETRSNNDNEKHKMVDVVEAAPVQDLDHIEQGRLPDHVRDVFHAKGKRVFNDRTTPSAKTFAGDDTGIDIRIKTPPRRVMKLDISRPEIFNPGGVPYVLENDAYRYGRYSVVPAGKGSEALSLFKTTPGGYLVFGAQIFFVGPKNSKGQVVLRLYEDKSGTPGTMILTKRLKLRTPSDGYYWVDVALAPNERGLKLDADKQYWVGITNERGKIYPGLNPQSVSKNSRFRRGKNKPLVSEFNFSTGREPVSDYIIRLKGFGFVDTQEIPPVLATRSDKLVRQMILADQMAEKKRFAEALESYESVKEKMELTPRRFDTWLPVLINSIGVCAYELKKYDLAMEHFEISLRRIQATEDLPNQADVFQNLGEASFHAGKFEQAKKYTDRARRLNYRLKRNDRLLENFYWLGRAYYDGKRLDRDRASEWFLKAREWTRTVFSQGSEQQLVWEKKIEAAEQGKAEDVDQVVKRFKQVLPKLKSPLERRKSLDLLQFLGGEAGGK